MPSLNNAQIAVYTVAITALVVLAVYLIVRDVVNHRRAMRRARDELEQKLATPTPESVPASPEPKASIKEEVVEPPPDPQGSLYFGVTLWLAGDPRDAWGYLALFPVEAPTMKENEVRSWANETPIYVQRTAEATLLNLIHALEGKEFKDKFIVCHGVQWVNEGPKHLTAVATRLQGIGRSVMVDLKSVTRWSSELIWIPEDKDDKVAYKYAGAHIPVYTMAHQASLSCWHNLRYLINPSPDRSEP